MRSSGELHVALAHLHERRDILARYRDQCIRIDDHHGVQDASSDLREVDAVEDALRWVLGERGNVGQ